MSLKGLFTSHPETVGETYGEHFLAALSYSRQLFAAGGAALVHAFLPFLCETTASQAVKRMHANMTARNAARALPPRGLARRAN